MTDWACFYSRTVCLKHCIQPAVYNEKPAYLITGSSETGVKRIRNSVTGRRWSSDWCPPGVWTAITKSLSSQQYHSSTWHCMPDTVSH